MEQEQKMKKEQQGEKDRLSHTTDALRYTCLYLNTLQSGIQNAQHEKCVCTNLKSKKKYTYSVPGLSSSLFATV